MCSRQSFLPGPPLDSLSLFPQENPLSEKSLLGRCRAKAWHWRYAVKAYLAGSVTHADTPEPKLALTFDDGPHPIYTPQLLDLLKSHGARATFFVTGEQAARFPELITRIKSEGHELGCHSWDHTSFRTLSLPAQWRQIRRWEAELGARGSKLFRPPFGHQSVLTHWLVRLCGYQVILWNALAEDWQDDDAVTLYARIADRIKPGAIVLLHDNLVDALELRFVDRQPVLQAVDTVLATHRDLRFVTVSELLQAPAHANRKPVFGRPPADFLDRLHRTAPYDV